MVGIDDQQIDGADEAPGTNRGSEGQDGASDHVPRRFGDEDAGLWQVDELAEQIRGIERAGAMIQTTVRVAEGDEAIDVGDTGGSDQVFHA